MHEHHLRQIVKKQKSGIAQGICSICSANRFVFQAALEHGRKHGTVVLIESTSNQVNQYGGYTGMTPQDFIDLATSTAREVQFSLERLILAETIWAPIHGKMSLPVRRCKRLVFGQGLRVCRLYQDSSRRKHALGRRRGDRSKPLIRRLWQSALPRSAKRRRRAIWNG